MIPKAMQFAAATTTAGFKLIDYPNEPAASVQVASNTRPGQNLAFKVSGEGTLEVPQESGPGRLASRPVQAAAPKRIIGPAADSARPSTLPILCSNTAGRSSEASLRLHRRRRLHSLSATVRGAHTNTPKVWLFRAFGRQREDCEPDKFRRRTLPSRPRLVGALPCSRDSKKNSSNSKSNAG